MAIWGPTVKVQYALTTRVQYALTTRVQYALTTEVLITAVPASPWQVNTTITGYSEDCFTRGSASEIQNQRLRKF